MVKKQEYVRHIFILMSIVVYFTSISAVTYIYRCILRWGCGLMFELTCRRQTECKQPIGLKTKSWSLWLLFWTEKKSSKLERMSQDLNESRVKKVYFEHFTVVIATSLTSAKEEIFLWIYRRISLFNTVDHTYLTRCLWSWITMAKTGWCERISKIWKGLWSWDGCTTSMPTDSSLWLQPNFQRGLVMALEWERFWQLSQVTQKNCFLQL